MWHLCQNQINWLQSKQGCDILSFLLRFMKSQKKSDYTTLGIPGDGKMPSIIINSNANMRWYKKTDTFAKEWKGCYTCSKVNQVNRLPSNVNTVIFSKFQSSWKMHQALKTLTKSTSRQEAGKRKPGTFFLLLRYGSWVLCLWYLYVKKTNRYKKYK